MPFDLERMRNTMTEDARNSKNTLKEGLLDLTFVPEWARRDPGKNPYSDVAPDFDKRSRSRERGPRRGGGRMERGRPPRDRSDSGPRRERRPDRRRDEERDRRAPPRERRLPDVPLKVAFVPERKGLGVIVRKIHKSKRAYALPDVASLFLMKPEVYLVKIERPYDPGAADVQKLYQCKSCRRVYTAREALMEHAAQVHLDEFFDVEETDTGEPSGQFPSVARCPLSGEWVGPPNHHSYTERIQQLHAARFSHMPLDAYRSKLEILRDEESIAAWKQAYSKQNVYRRKDQSDAEPLKWAAARSLFMAECADRLVKENNRFVIPGDVAKSLDDPVIRSAVRDAWNRESRFPTTLLHALRPALRHMQIHLFKASEKATFVTSVKPSPLDPEKAVSPIKEALQYLHDHPGCSREELLKNLVLPEPPEGGDVERSISTALHWLVDKGHVIEFHDGRMSVPVSSSRAVGQ